MFHKILVALDLLQGDSCGVAQSANRSVFDTALHLAKTSNARLLLVYVLPPVYPVVNAVDIYAPIYAQAMERLAEERALQDRETLEVLRSLTLEATTAGVTTEFTQNIGNPGETITELAKTWEADLIVMGNRGLKGLGELILGSISNYVVHHAACSVMTVKQSLSQPKVAQESMTVEVVRQS